MKKIQLYIIKTEQNFKFSKKLQLANYTQTFVVAITNIFIIYLMYAGEGLLWTFGLGLPLSAVEDCNLRIQRILVNLEK